MARYCTVCGMTTCVDPLCGVPRYREITLRFHYMDSDGWEDPIDWDWEELVTQDRPLADGFPDVSYFPALGLVQLQTRSAASDPNDPIPLT